MSYLVPYFPVTPTSAMIVSMPAVTGDRQEVTDFWFALSSWRMAERRQVQVDDGLEKAFGGNVEEAPRLNSKVLAKSLSVVRESHPLAQYSVHNPLNTTRSQTLNSYSSICLAR